jgi:hypothetical protein
MDYRQKPKVAFDHRQSLQATEFSPAAVMGCLYRLRAAGSDADSPVFGGKEAHTK